MSRPSALPNEAYLVHVSLLLAAQAIRSNRADWSPPNEIRPAEGSLQLVQGRAVRFVRVVAERLAHRLRFTC